MTTIKTITKINTLAYLILTFNQRKLMMFKKKHNIPLTHKSCKTLNYLYSALKIPIEKFKPILSIK